MTRHLESLERIDPERLRAGEVTGQETLRLHLQRYNFAAAHITGGEILDIACGVGYGTELLAALPSITGVTGVDIDPDAIERARTTCRSSKVKFIVGDAARYAGPSQYDAIVSLETIEHLEHPAGFLDCLVAQLRRGGLLIASVPVTPSVDGNPHHCTDFSDRTFRKLGAQAGLSEIDSLIQVQRFNPCAVATGSEVRAARHGMDLLRWYGQHPGSLLRRVVTTLRHGFTNIYRTQVWRLP